MFKHVGWDLSITLHITVSNGGLFPGAQYSLNNILEEKLLMASISVALNIKYEMQC